MRVARAFHRDPLAVAEQPLAATAWAHLQLMEIERMEDIQRDAEDLRSACRVSMAFNDPKALGDEQIALRLRIRAGDAALSPQAARARGLAMAAEIAARGVMLQ